MTAKFKMVDLPSEQSDQAASGPELIVRCAADVKPEPVEWLWPGRIALGKLTLIAGEAGLGKSQLSIAPLGNYYATLNTTVPPFNNPNLRRAVVAAANRAAYLRVRGGSLVGTVATHFLGPTDSAFQAADQQRARGHR